MALAVNAKNGDGLKHETVNAIGQVTNATGDSIGAAKADMNTARSALTVVQATNNANQSDLQTVNTTMATQATQRSNQQAAISAAKARLDVLEHATPPGPTTPPPPDAPTGLTVLPANITTNSMVLSWTPPAGGSAPTGYQTQYALSVVVAPPNVESAHDTTVTNTSGQIVDASLNVWTLVASGGAAAPAPAAAAGYTVQTFGPAMSLGTNWFKWASDVNATQNSDGSITTTGGNNTWGQNVITALPSGTGTGFAGNAWTGGAYFEWTMSFTGTANPGSIANGWPSLWLIDMEGPGFSNGSQAHWQGQAANYYRWTTINVAEWANDHTPMASPNTIYHELSDFYGIVGSNVQVETGYHANGSPYTLPTGFDLTRQHKYGFLWVPATASTQGYARYYVDGVRVDTGVAVWNNYNPATAPPPVLGTTAFSFLDSRHIAAVFGTGPQNPLTVSAFSVWQSSGTGSASGFQIAINGKLQTVTSDVVLMKYYNPAGPAKVGTTKHSVVQQNSGGGWYMSTGVVNDVASWVQLTGDPDVADPVSGTSPAPAAAVGYNSRTLGPQVIIGGSNPNWFKNDAATVATTNVDGSVTLAGQSNNYNYGILTGDGHSFGTAYGGGMYIEIDCSWVNALNSTHGWPSLWANSVEGRLIPKAPNWPAGVNAGGGGDAIEWDIMETFSDGWGPTVWDWSIAGETSIGTTYSPFDAAWNAQGGVHHAPANGTRRKIGALWVPATSTTQGRTDYYLNGTLIPEMNQHWNLWNSSIGLPLVNGSTADSIMDFQHFTMLAGTGAENPMTIYSIEIWQKDGTRNLPPTGSTAGSGAPARAAAQGYNIQTFGPNVILSGANQNWLRFEGAGGSGTFTNNSDGSVTIIPPSGSGDGHQWNTANFLGGYMNFVGRGFGGGGYFVARMKWAAGAGISPAWWSNDMEGQTGFNLNNVPIHWPGQASDYNLWFEPDFMEAAPGDFGSSFWQWYGRGSVGAQQGVQPLAARTSVSDTNVFHDYGCLWVPATPSQNGFIAYDVDGREYGRASWAYRADRNTLPGPPPTPGADSGSNITVPTGSDLDWRHLYLILGSDTGVPFTVASVSVWQKDGTKNISA